MLEGRKTENFKVGDILQRKSAVSEKGRWPAVARDDKNYWSEDWFPLVVRVIALEDGKRWNAPSVGTEVVYAGLEGCPDWIGHTLEGRLKSPKGWWVPPSYYEKVDPSIAIFWELTR